LLASVPAGTVVRAYAVRLPGGVVDL
jgi:hypothetical protein